MDKLTFPKGSLKFKKLEPIETSIEESSTWKQMLKDYHSRKQYVLNIEKTYPGPTKKLPEEILNSFMVTTKKLKQTRSEFKKLSEVNINNKYEITFKHPKWFPIIGEIKINSEKNNLKKTLKEVIKQFQLMKNTYRKLRIREKIIKINGLRAEIKYNVSGGIIYMPEVRGGVYIKFLKDQEKQIVFAPKKPKDNNNYIGCELEFMCDLNQKDLGLELFNAGVGKQVTLTSDGSLRCCDDSEPSNCEDHKDKTLHELCILMKEDNYKEIMEKVCKVLSNSNAVINKSCGMHVHLDMRNRNAEQAYQNLLSSQTILFKMNPKSRMEKWAKRTTERDFEKARNGTGETRSERYLGINPIAMAKHNTLEIRIHGGTIDFAKITNWISILLKVANHSKRVVHNYVSLKTFCEEFNIEDSLKQYMQERIQKFTPKDNQGIVDVERGVA